MTIYYTLNPHTWSQDRRDEALFEAAKSGHLALVNLLVQSQADPLREFTYRNQNALSVASEYGQLSVVNRLLEIPVVFSSVSNSNTLVLAARNGYLPIVNRLLEIPAVFNSVSNSGALMFAASNGYLEIVNRLLEIPAVRAAAGREGNSAIVNAAGHGRLEVINRLLEVPAVVEAMMAGHTLALAFAATNNKLAIVNRLLEPALEAITSTEMKMMALRNAAKHGRLPIVNRLLEIPEVKQEYDSQADIKQVLQNKNFHLWQTNQRAALLTAIEGTMAQQLPPEISLSILQQAFPMFSKETVVKQCKLIAYQRIRQRTGLLTAIEGTMAQQLPPEIALSILQRAFPMFSEKMVEKQYTFIADQKNKTPELVTFQAPVTTNSNNKRKRDNDNNEPDDNVQGKQQRTNISTSSW